MEYLLGIDIGTSGTKTVLFDRDANPITAKTFEYPLYQEQNGWAEQEPADWWNAVVQGVQAVLQASGVDAADIKGIGLSGQMHGLVMLDENGEVLRRSIIWCDQRTGRGYEPYAGCGKNHSDYSEPCGNRLHGGKNPLGEKV